MVALCCFHNNFKKCRQLRLNIKKNFSLQNIVLSLSFEQYEFNHIFVTLPSGCFEEIENVDVRHDQGDKKSRFS